MPAYNVEEARMDLSWCMDEYYELVQLDRLAGNNVNARAAMARLGDIAQCVLEAAASGKEFGRLEKEAIRLLRSVY